jgi:hypothetical protein
MKNYKILKLKNLDFSYLVLSTSYVNPLDYVEDIVKKIKENSSMRILFDLLLSNGDSDNRFIEATFDGKKLDNFRACQNVDLEIKKASVRYYQENTKLLDNSVLSRPHKYLIRKGKTT